MLLEIDEVNQGKIVLIPTPLNQLPLSNLLPDISWTGKGAHIKATFEMVTGTGFFITLSQYDAAKKSILRARGQVSAVELRIMLGRPIRGKWDGIRNAALETDQFSLDFTPVIETEAIFDPSIYKTLDIHFELPFLERYAKYFPLLDAFLETVHLVKPVTLAPHHYYCSPSMSRAVKDLLRHPYGKRGQDILLEPKVIELLLAALEITHHHADRKHQPAKIIITEQDEMVLRDVKKRIIDCDFRPLSYQELCESGIGEHKLFDGFRQLFGTTPYQFFLDGRMQEAERLLITTSKSVTEIAYTLQYNHLSSFSAEFSIRFGCTPSEYRRRHKIA